jgi:SAM-dependent methyltransferase
MHDGMCILDVGCGPGTITIGLAGKVAPSGRVVGVDMHASQIELACHVARESGTTNADFLAGTADALPFDDGSFDVVFAHALFEHLSDPAVVLTEMRRVLRTTGTLAVCSSDWSGARVDPFTRAVERALDAHFALRRRAGGDPFAGGKLAEWVTAVGFSLEHTGATDRSDMGYTELARYVEKRIVAALDEGVALASVDLAEARTAAASWAGGRPGTATQRWVHVLARR